jgi:hypothetical protein
MTKKVRIIYRERGKGREIGREKENEGMESMIAGERGRKRKGEGEGGREREGGREIVEGRERLTESQRGSEEREEREREREREREGGREVQPKSANASQSCTQDDNRVLPPCYLRLLPKYVLLCNRNLTEGGCV